MPNEIIVESSAGRVRSNKFDFRCLGSESLRIFALLVLLTAAAVSTSFSLAPFSNGDIWWHLSSGLWVLRNHSIPRTGLFSQYPDRPWVDSSWEFDVMTAAAYRLLGLKAFAAVLMAFRVGLAWATFLLARGRRANFWGAIVLSVVAQFAIGDLWPLPILLSILFFGVELLLLLESRRSGNLRPLYWLPVLFFLWANLHGQFLVGLVLLGIFLAAEAAEFFLPSSRVRTPSPPLKSLSRVFTTAGLTVATTLLTPYPLRMFHNALQAAYAKTMFKNFQEMQAMSFRRPSNFVLMLLAMTAFLALGRQRSRDLFKLCAMAAFLVLAFRVGRDGWCVVLPAVAVIGDALADWRIEVEPRTSGRRWKWETPLVGMLVLVVLVAASIHMPNGQFLMKQISRGFPTQACDYIRDNRLPGPIFNTYYWGGFLTWYLPEYPVSIDSRVNLYGNGITDRYFKVSEGNERFETEPKFTGAHTILLEHDSGMLKALTTLPALRDQFRIAYQDRLATVLVRQ